MSVVEYSKSAGHLADSANRRDFDAGEHGRPDGVGVQAAILLGLGAGAVLTVLWTMLLIWAAGRLIGLW